MDVIIIGAGASGLACAAALAAAGRDVIVLEARERIGGRVHTIREPGLALPIELGAEFVHGLSREILEIVDDAGLLLVDTGGRPYRSADRRFTSVEGMYDRIEGIFRTAAEVSDDDLSLDDTLSLRFSGDELASARALVRGYVEGFHAAPLDRVGVRYLLEADQAATIEESAQFHLPGGYDRVIAALARGLAPGSVRLGTTVTAVRWGRGAVEVEAKPVSAAEVERLRASCVVVTVPLGVLQALPGEAGSISFDPPLPEATRNAIERLGMGAVLKLVLRVRDPVWTWRREDGERVPWDLKFLHTTERIPTWWTPLPVRAPLIVGWAGTSSALSLPTDPPSLVAEAAASLSRALGVTREFVEDQIVACHVHDWTLDPLCRGAYSYIPAGAMDAPAALAEPVDGVLFFAGEATTGAGQNGTVHGAIASGKRAAEAVMHFLSG